MVNNYALGGGLSDGYGCAGIAQAPSNSNRIYMAYNAQYYRSDNRGDTWTAIGTTFKLFANTGAQRLFNNRVAVNATNQNEALFSTCNAGVRYTTDAGANMPQVSGIASVAANYGGFPNPPLVAISEDGTKYAIFEQSVGAKVSTDGIDGPYNLATGSPTVCADFHYDAFGRLWVVDPDDITNGVHYWNGTSWTTLSLPTSWAWKAVVVNPLDINDITILHTGGAALRTLDGGATFIHNEAWQGSWPAPIGIYKYNLDVPYLNGTSTFIANAVHKRTGARRLVAAEGLGVMESTPPVVWERWDWYEVSRGIEELGVLCSLTVPGRPGFHVVGTADKMMFKNPSSTSFPNQKIHPHPAQSIDHCWKIDYAGDDPDFIAWCANYNNDSYGYSNDLLDTVNLFPTMPQQAVAGATFGGTIAVSTKQIIIVGTANNMKYEWTRDGGNTWNYLTLGGEQLVNWINSMWVRRNNLTADKSQPGVFYVLVNASNQGSVNANFRGIWKIVITESTFTGTRILPGPIHAGSSDFWHCTLAWVPHSTGVLLYTPGQDYAGSPFYRLTDNGDGTMTSAVLPGITDVHMFDFGAKAPGSPYYSIIAYGKVSGVQGHYISIDNAASWTLLTTSLLDNPLMSGFCAADINEFGRYYVGTAGNGIMVGQLESKLVLT